MVLALLLFLLGIIVGNLASTPPRLATALEWIVVRVALPALVLDRVSQMELGPDAVVPVMTAWSVAASLAGMILLLARVGGWERATTGALLLVVPLGNTSFLGLPAIEALLGADHLGAALLYDQLGSFFLLITYGSWVAARFDPRSNGRVHPGAMARRLLRFPPFLALAAALTLNPLEVPQPFYDVLGPVGSLVGPLALLSVGLRARLPERDAPVGPVALGLLLRLVVAPLAVLGVAVAAGASGMSWSVAVLQAGMPPMVTAGIIASQAGLDRRAATLAVSGGLLASLVTLPLLAGAIPWR